MKFTGEFFFVSVKFFFIGKIIFQTDFSVLLIIYIYSLKLPKINSLTPKQYFEILLSEMKRSRSKQNKNIEWGYKWIKYCTYSSLPLPFLLPSPLHLFGIYEPIFHIYIHFITFETHKIISFMGYFVSLFFLNRLWNKYYNESNLACADSMSMNKFRS